MAKEKAKRKTKTVETKEKSTEKIEQKKMPKTVQPLETVEKIIQKNAPQEKQETPLYFILIVIVFFAAIGFTAYNFFTIPDAIVSVDNGDGNSTLIIVPDALPKEKVEVIALGSPEFFALGGKRNTVLDLFEERNIAFSIRPVSIHSDEGRALIEQFNVTALSTVFVNQAQLNAYRKVNARYRAVVQAIDETFATQDDYYVVPETFLDRKSRVKLFLESPVESCVPADSNASEKVPVYLFEDPYCPNCVVATSAMQTIMETYEDAVDFTYKYAPGQSVVMYNAGQDKERIETTAVYFLAAQEQGLLQEFKTCFTNYYCDKDGDGLAGRDDIELCHENNEHFNVPLTFDELASCIDSTGLDANKTQDFFDNRYNAGQKETKALAEAYGIVVSGIAVVDCRVTDLITKSDNILYKKFCDLKENPDFSVCPTPEIVDENAAEN